MIIIFILDLQRGYNKGDHSSTGILKYNYNKDTLDAEYIGIRADYFKQSPTWFDQQYSSNNFFWNYTFDPTYTGKAGLFYNYKTLNLAVNYFQIRNYIYYDNYARPKQFNNYIELLQLVLKKDFKWKKWEIDNKILYQKTFGANVIRLPELMSKHSLYFNHAFFKKALISQIGVDLAFNNKYYADEYMPATSQFYIQNKKQIGNYPYIDLFLNAKIKRANIFVKLQHATEGLLDKTYYSTPHYPLQGRAIKFGVCWKFYD